MAHHRIRILIADDHAVLRRTLTDMLTTQPDFEITGEVSNGLEAVEHARRLCPDVVLMDVNMPRVNGVAATREVVRLCPGVRVLGLTMFDQERIETEMLEAGACATVDKAGGADNLFAAIRSAVQQAVGQRRVAVFPGDRHPGAG